MRILRYYGTHSSKVALQLPAFQKLMSDMNTVPVLGTSFNVYCPLLLVVLCTFTFYKVGDARWYSLRHFPCEGSVGRHTSAIRRVSRSQGVTAEWQPGSGVFHMKDGSNSHPNRGKIAIVQVQSRRTTPS